MLQPEIIDQQFLGIAGAIASYLYETRDGLLLIESGPSTSVPALRTALKQRGYSVADVKHILLTHIHFDHAGGAGWWAQQGAHLYVHHIGAPHLVDPSRLIRSAARIYGADMERLWGTITPAPRERVTALHDGDVVEIGDLTFDVWETPGHAGHHHAFALEDIIFCGDVAGVRFLSHLTCPTPPPEYQQALWHASIARIRAGDFSALYPTHFGRIDAVDAHLTQIEAIIDRWTSFVEARHASGMTRDAIVEAFIALNQAQATADGLTPAQWEDCMEAFPQAMSVDGILRYLQRRERH